MHTRNRSPGVQRVNCWPAQLGDLVWILMKAEILLIINRHPLHISFHSQAYNWLNYDWNTVLWAIKLKVIHPSSHPSTDIHPSIHTRNTDQTAQMCWIWAYAIYACPYRKNSKNWDTWNNYHNCPTIGTVGFYSAALCSKDADRITNREDPDQTAPWGAVWSGSALFALTYLSQYLKLLRYVVFIFQSSLLCNLGAPVAQRG